MQAQRNDCPQSKIMLTVPEAAQILRIDKVTVYEMAKTRGFPAIRIGRRVLIPRDALLRWIENEAMKEHAAV